MAVRTLLHGDMMWHESTPRICFFFATLGLFFLHPAPNEAFEAEGNIKSMISRNIQLRSKPVDSVEDSVPVVLGIDPIHVNEVDEVNGVLTLTVWISQRWNSKFTWESSAFDGLTRIVSTARGKDFEMWHPDIALLSSVGEEVYLPAKLDKEYIMFNDGEVVWWSQTTLKSPCLFNSSSVRCDMTFGSWRHTSTEIDIKIPHRDSKSDYLKNYYPTGIWRIVEVDFSKSKTYYPYSNALHQNIIFSVYLNKSEEFAKRFEVKAPSLIASTKSDSVRISPSFLSFIVFNFLAYML